MASSSEDRSQSSRRKRRRLVVGAVIAVLALSAGVWAVFFDGRGGGRQALGGGFSSDPRLRHDSGLRLCPLTGTELEEGAVPNRPALAIKVENLPIVRPQVGLSFADIIYEEPVEAGITRFIVVYQCQDASRVQPVRSARLTDPDILVQFGRPLFGYAGAVPPVVEAVREAGLIDVNFNTAAAAGSYHRDPERPAPHNVYTSTKDLYEAAASSWKRTEGAPRPVFVYAQKAPRGKRVSEIHLPFSSSSDVYWRWDASRDAFLRSHGEEPHTYSDGSQVAATNVVVQVVKVRLTDVHDVNGAPSPEVVSTGEGKAYVLRDGRIVVGRWRRPTVHDLTRFYDARGNEVKLAPGNTWVELLPAQIEPSYS